ncbi:centriolar coiled-coil protein of 110 kDa isoform X2 [Drosophila eugracilis]|nr:centriolar coiled-coil protein of 110 kDa isoform X2 [Drosophila eugracilis]
MEQLLDAVELSRTHSEASTPTPTATISIWSAPSEGSSGFPYPAFFRFRLDGQAILPPLMTSAKRRDVQQSRQMAMKLEERYRLARHSAGSDMASPQSLSQLQQTETFIYDSTRGHARPQTLILDIKLPTIHVDPPTPQPPLENSSARRHNRITDRILQFEQSGLGKLLPKVQEKRILRSSTSPSIAKGNEQPWHELKEMELTASQTEPATFQRSRSFTLEEPSQVLVEHMQREALVVKPNQNLANFQRQTIESQAKRVNPSLRCNSNNTSKTTTNTNTTTTYNSYSKRDREVERIIERALDERGPQEANRKAGVRNYLRGHRERMNQLILHQEEERRRMQAQFEVQQRQLVEELCAEIDISAGTDNPDRQVSQSTSTGDLRTVSPTPTIFSFMDATLRKLKEHDDLSSMDDSSRIAAPSSARKRLFSPKLSIGYDSEPQSLGEISAPSTPRSLPLRNSSLTNSRQAVRRRSQTVGSNSRKLNSSAGREVIKSPTKGGGEVGRPKSSTGNGISTVSKRNTATPARSTSSPKRLMNKNANLESEERQVAATRINAAVRGFLVRRLFATEQVQRIVQTIRDTLIFVLNLHLETCDHTLDAEEPGNLRLKARLLQQLCSASRALHLIFFQTNIKERMEIIARDRKRITTKHLLKHR